MQNVSPERVQEFCRARDVGAAWLATISTSAVLHLSEIKVALEILAWMATLGFTLWRWWRAAKKGERD